MNVTKKKPTPRYSRQIGGSRCGDGSSGVQDGAGIYKRREIKLGGIKQIRHKDGLQNAGSISHSL